MDGFEATRHLRENGYSRPVIALTAHGLAEERDRCLHSGFSDYLSKPVNRATLIDHIAHFH
jgi:CheY-like chemotaxis protein